MLRMAEITPRHYLYGVIIMMFFIVGGMAMLAEMNDGNSKLNTGMSDEFNNTFNRLGDTQSQVDVIEGNINNADTDLGVFGVLNALISSAWQSLKLMFTSWAFMSAVFSGLTAFFGVPVWIVSIIGMFITITLAFAIYSLIFQKDA